MSVQKTVKRPKGQNFAVISFAEAHPNYMEQAEISTFITFMRETWHKFSAGKRFKPKSPKDKTGKLECPPRDINPNNPEDKKYLKEDIKMVKETIDSVMQQHPTGETLADQSTIPANNVDELLEDYVLWKNCNVIKIKKYFEKFHPNMPTSRAIFIYGLYNSAEDALPMRNAIAIKKKVDVYTVPIIDEKSEPAAILYNPPKTLIKNQKYDEKYVDDLMNKYYENQREADQLNDDIQQIAIRKARERNAQNKKILDEQMSNVDVSKTAAEKMAEVERMNFMGLANNSSDSFIPMPKSTGTVAPTNSPTEPLPELENLKL